MLKITTNVDKFKSLRGKLRVILINFKTILFRQKRVAELKTEMAFKNLKIASLNLQLLMIKSIVSIRELSRSYSAFAHLSRQGFRITRSGHPKTLHIHRFFWKGQMIRPMPDIDEVDGRFYTMHDGQSEPLDKK